MPDLLGPTNPVPAREPQPLRIAPQPPGDTTVQNIVNPNVVSRPDARTDQQDSGDAAGAGVARYESSFMNFLQRLRGAAELPQIFLEILQGTSVTSGIREGFAKELSEYMDFLEMDEGQLAAFLQNQVRSGSRFTGALFQALRHGYASTGSDLVKNEILQFARRFSDFSSTPHLESKMLRTVSDMRGTMPSRWGDQIPDIVAKLENGIAAGDRKGNLELMREKVFPLISNYVSTTHDHGAARELLSLLTLDVARYEDGAEEPLLQAMRHLANLDVLPRELAQMSDTELLEVLKNTEYEKAGESNSFAEHTAEIVHKALQGEGGAKAQEAFHNIMNAILINESVYMPLQHVMVPLNWNGEMMFSEMWVDPDADREGPPRSGESRTLRLLIKMDIQHLGAFDLLIQSRGENVSLAVAAPQAVADNFAPVSEALSEILRRNGLRPDSVSVTQLRRPVTVSEVFPKLMERMGGINVKI